MTDYQVIVVGAGAAGLMAARELADRGVTSLAVVEARDRIGGRTTGRALHGYDAVHIELGGQFVRSEAQDNIRREARRYSIRLTSPSGEEMRSETVRWVMGGVPRGGVPVPVEELHLLEKAVVRINDAARRPSAARLYDRQDLEDIDVGFDEFFAPLNLTPATREFLYGFVGGTLRSDPGRLSMLPILPWVEAGTSFTPAFIGDGAVTFADGTHSLLNALAEDSGADLVLGSPVVEVVQRPDSVTVRNERGEDFSAKACVMAMPSNLLGRVAFSPTLSADKLDVLAPQREYIVPGFKRFLVVEEAIPNLTGYAGYGHANEPRIGSLGEFGRLPDGRTLMLAWGRGPAFRGIEDAQDAVRVYMPEARVVGMDGHGWAGDPFSGGMFRLVTPQPGTDVQLGDAQAGGTRGVCRL